MRARDWAGSVFVTALLALAGYLHSKTPVVVVLVAICLVAAAFIGFDVGRDRPRDRGVPAAPPPLPAELALVDQPHSRQNKAKSLQDEGDQTWLYLSTEMWVTNTHPTETLTLLATRLDEVVRDGLSVVRNSNVPGMLYTVGANSSMVPIALPPGQVTDIGCTFRLTPTGDGKGGFVEPQTVEATVVLIDQLGNRHQSERLWWH